MREFRYRALTRSGEMVVGIRQASDSATLATQILSQNLVLLDSRPTLGSFGKTFSGAGRAGRRELRDFTLHLATCLGAGVPVITALRDFESATISKSFRDVLVDIREEIAGGTQIAEALSRHTETFSEVYLAMVHAGEDSGKIAECFAQLVAYLEWNDDLRGKSQQALVYPAILMGGIAGLFTLLLLFVIPRFAAVFEAAHFELPALTRSVLNFWTLMRHGWPFLVIGIVASVVAFNGVKRTPRGRYLLDKLLLRLPVVGSFAHRLALSRFARHFALLFGTGTGLLQLLELLQRVVGNAVLERELADIRTRVVTGETLTASFAPSPWFPPLIQRLIAVGEKTGNLDTTLMKAAQYLDAELPRDLQRAFKIFDALVLIILGGLIVVAVMSLLMPILQMRGELAH
jgi:type II secretory pathway component PulF